ncbi:MAG TPA: GNAT family N-acetyltransferase [Anaeromyxobacteraceae bacterium]|nr:GNAT family N-acetyltransferase [Anaeromyxobacteraceae bacterium]
MTRNLVRNVMAPVRIVESSDPARLASLRDSWGELFAAAGCDNPFLSWEWQYTWWRCFGQRRPVWIVEARDRGERLAGLVALAARPALGTPRRWALLTNGLTGTDAVDLLVRPGFGPAVRDAVARALAAAMERWDVVDLEDLPCGSATVPAFRNALQARGVHVTVAPACTCPGFALRGTFAGHLAGFRRRDTYLRRRRWLEKQPGYRIEVATRPEEAGPAMEDFLRLHHLRWDPEGGSGGIPRGPVEDFHRQVAPLLAARGWLRMYRMFLGEASIAAVYGLQLGRRFYYYQSGMDPAHASRSPGLVLIGKTVEDAYAAGLADYDFLRGTEPHKLDWAADRRETLSLRLRAPGLRSDAGAAAEELFRRARAAARAVAPEGMWHALQRVRRDVTVNHLAGGAARPAPRTTTVDAPAPPAQEDG